MTRLDRGAPLALLLVVAVALGGACVDATSTTTTSTAPVTPSSTTSTTEPMAPVTPSSSTSTTVPLDLRSSEFEEPDRLVVLGSLPLTPYVTDVWGYVDDQGREFAIVGSRVEDTGSGSLFIVDVSDPTNPVVAGQIDDIPAFDVKTRGRYAYATDDKVDGVIVDLADPYAPVVVGSMPAAHNFFFDDAGHLYLARAQRGAVFSVADDPTAPRPVDTPIPDHHDSLAIDDRLYVFGGFNPTHIYDIADPLSPILVGVIADPVVEYHHSGWPTEDGRHLFIADETALGARADVTVWDVTSPSQPALVGTYVDPGAAAHNVQIRGDFAFLSYYGAGIVVLDVSEPTHPFRIAEYDPIPGKIDGWAFADYGTLGIYTRAPSGVIYASGSEGLTLLRFTPPRLPRPILR